MMTKILRLPEVQELTGLKRTTIYEKMKTGEFPVRIALTTRTVGWIQSEIEAWIESKINQARMHAAR
jgi:prophage regulatory protein